MKNPQGYGSKIYQEYREGGHPNPSGLEDLRLIMFYVKYITPFYVLLSEISTPKHAFWIFFHNKVLVF